MLLLVRSDSFEGPSSSSWNRFLLFLNSLSLPRHGILETRIRFKDIFLPTPSKHLGFKTETKGLFLPENLVAFFSSWERPGSILSFWPLLHLCFFRHGVDSISIRQNFSFSRVACSTNSSRYSSSTATDPMVKHVNNEKHQWNQPWPDHLMVILSWWFFVCDSVSWLCRMPWTRHTKFVNELQDLWTRIRLSGQEWHRSPFLIILVLKFNGNRISFKFFEKSS